MATLVQGRRPAYDVLSPDDLREQLRGLPGWRCEGGRLLRTVTPDDLWGLLERVAAAEAELDHHSVVQLDRGTVTFLVWTHVREAVTGADVALAHRIDQAVAGIATG